MKEVKEPEIWQDCVVRLEEETSLKDFNQWIRPLQAINDGGRLILLAHNQHVKKTVAQKYLTRIKELVNQLGDPGYPIRQVDLLVGDRENERALPIRATNRNGTLLKADFTFDRFVEGGSNRWVKGVALEVAASPALKFNPFLIYGGVGLGKTHLMQAVGNHIKSHIPQIEVTYIYAQTFVTEMVKALTKPNSSEHVRRFTEPFHSADVLLVDDIQFLAAKDKCQEEFFHVFNRLIETEQSQIVLSSDQYPSEIEGLDARLSSRFIMGITAEVKPPDLETRAAILVQKATEHSVNLDLTVALYIAQRVKTNVRELENALRQVLLAAQLRRMPISIELVQETLRDLFAIHRRQVSIDKIQKQVADYYNIRLADLHSPTRVHKIVRPRQMAMALAHELTDLPLQAIGQNFGKDHTTVLNAIKRIGQLRQTSAQLEEDYNRLERVLTS
ncbi:MAG: chromosomal replication initiator protein DnaA [Gammaproteobacteria bacterium]|nr:chromosomal replication initiator protein DnaA [Gammaproteobacteria bacterium]